MRILSQEEIQYISGAAFSDDVSALAAGIVILQYIYFAGAYATAHLGGIVYNAAMGSPYQPVIQKITQKLTPLGGIIMPTVVIDRIFRKHPEYWDHLQEKYNAYF